MKEINVYIGQIRISKGPDGVLKAILGSCVGIGFIWRERGIAGLAHCLLPRSPQSLPPVGGKFVDQAIPSLLAMMRVRDEDLPRIQAVLAGGGNMTSSAATAPDRLVGSSNVRMADRELEKRGIPVVFREVGGMGGRRILIDCSDYSYKVEHIPRCIATDGGER